jgi:hypothetical protein
MAKYFGLSSSGAPQQFSTVNTSGGAGDADKIPALDAGGKISMTMMPSGIGADTRTVTAGETLAAGDLIYLDSAGEAFKADANVEAKAAVGFVLAGITAAASGTAYFGSGIITGLSGLTAGSFYFLSNSTPGSRALYASLTFSAGDIIQKVGYALSSSELYFEPQPHIVW